MRSVQRQLLAERRLLNSSSESRSPVTAVYDWYDGIREGTTEIDGRKFTFKSRRLDCDEYSGDIESVDLFDLEAVDNGERILATAQFEGSAKVADAEDQQDLFATWSIIERSVE